MKGEIVDVLKLLLDDDKTIRNQVELFLEELNHENQLYNLFQTAIHRLSGPDFKQLRREDYEEIIRKYYSCFNEERKKQLENLIDSMTNTLKNSDNHTEQMNSVFCLSLMPFNKNPKSIEKMLDSAKYIRDILNGNDELKKYLKDNLIKQLSAFPNPEIKEKVEELKTALVGSDTEVDKLKSPQLMKKSSSTKRAPKKKAADQPEMMSDSQASVMSQTTAKGSRKKRSRAEMESSSQKDKSSELINLDDSNEKE